MSAPGIITDHNGNRYATVHVEDLEDCRWLLARLEDWLAHCQPETAEDWADFTGPQGARLQEMIDMLGRWSIHMRQLTEEAR